jgi:hypothetical protein
VSTTDRIFLLSPAKFGGVRTSLLLRESAEFDLSVRLRQGTANIGEVYAFLSGLYFRGKLAYARAFGSAFVIVPGLGLLPPETVVSVDTLRKTGTIPVDEGRPDYRDPLVRAAAELAENAGPDCEFVLLGSVASTKYTEPLLEVLDGRLLFPAEFVGRGDMSRGGLMLRCIIDATELSYIQVRDASVHGKRPAKLIPMPRKPPTC